MACGARLERRCPNCGAPAPADARFCMSCGDPLDEAHAEVAGARVPVRLSEERRQVTVLFADLSGYTAVAERMDPEAVKALVDRALMRLGGEVERHGGTVDKYIGDNVMAIFGAPVAHEDDAERAVRAGLGMQSAMDEVNGSLPAGVHFDLRVGMNTGEVLAGAVGRSYTVVGDTVNVAARLQSAARPGSVTVGERTMRATSGAVRYEPLEPLELRGKSAPTPLPCSEPAASTLWVERRPHASPRWWGGRRRSPGSRPSSNGWSVREVPTSSRSWERRAWGSRDCCASSSAVCGSEPGRPPCAPAAACRTAPASSSGRSAR